MTDAGPFDVGGDDRRFRLLPGAGWRRRTIPHKPIRLIVGFAAGGIADLGARLLGDHITRETGQPVVVENRSAAAGTVAAQAVAKAPPDGYTLGVVLSGQLVINPFVQKAMPLDALKDLLPVAAIGEAPQMIAINAGVPAKTLKEFVALAKAKPDTMSYASAGFGSLPHLSAAEFLRQAGISLVHVPYKGNQPATDRSARGDRCSSCRARSAGCAPASMPARSGCCWSRPRTGCRTSRTCRPRPKPAFPIT